MGKCGTVQPEATDGNIIRRMRIACWITKATNTHSEYVFITVISRITLQRVWRPNRPRLLGTSMYEGVRLGRGERWVLTSRFYAYTPFPSPAVMHTPLSRHQPLLRAHPFPVTSRYAYTTFPSPAVVTRTPLSRHQPLCIHPFPGALTPSFQLGSQIENCSQV